MTNHSSAKAFESPRENRSDAFPLLFTGCARLAVDREALARRLSVKLHAAASPMALDDERMRAYADDRGLAHHRFEAALLSEALKVVSADKLIERLADDLRTRMPRLLETPLTISAEQRAGTVILRLGSAPLAEPRYVIAGDQPQWSVLPGASTCSGVLSLVGELTGRDGATMRIDAGWQVRPGQSCAALGESASASFRAPVSALIGCVAGDALERFSRAVPREIAAVSSDAREPTFVNVERLLRLGRLTHSTRVYLLYWKRLRDYLIWSAAR